MSPRVLNESVVEDAVMGWLGELGYDALYGPDIAPDELRSERSSYEEGKRSRSFSEVNRRWY